MAGAGRRLGGHPQPSGEVSAGAAQASVGDRAAWMGYSALSQNRWQAARRASAWTARDVQADRFQRQKASAPTAIPGPRPRSESSSHLRPATSRPSESQGGTGPRTLESHLGRTGAAG
jgi:hypothetical protein